MDVELEDYQKYAGVAVIEFFFWGLFAYFGLNGWIPAFPVFAVLLGVANVLMVVAGYYTNRDEAMPGFEFEATTQEQLTEHEARVLARYMMVYIHGFRVERSESGVEPAVSSSDDKEDAVRLFRYEFRPLNRSGKVTMYMDLEQGLSVDTEDLDSLHDAAREVQNKVLVKSWMTEEYEEVCEEKKKSLGRSVDPLVKVEETDDGRTIREYPARLQNRVSGSNPQESG